MLKLLIVKKYILLGTAIVIINFGLSFLLPSGGVFADSLSYFGIAADLPNPVTDLFPFGYPLMLRAFFEIFGDYFWAYKFLNTAMIVVVLVFSFRKKFYFKETVLLFTGKTLFFVFSIAISEGLFIFLLYFLLYFFHQILIENKKSYLSVVFASLIMIAMLMVRYSGMYIYLAIIVFSAYYFFKTKGRIISRKLLVFLALSGFGMSVYLLFNFNMFGSFTGENLRGKPEEILPIYILRDLLGTANAVNPYIGLKPASNSVASLAFQFFVLLIDIGVFIYLVKFFRKAKSTFFYDFHVLLWTICGCYAVSLLVSGWFQQIEEMSTRLMAAANFCLFFSFLILYFKDNRPDKTLFRIACFFIAFQTLYALKSPENYLENRKEIEPQMSEFKHKKYLYDNQRVGAEAVTTYHIPVLNKTFQYKHTNNQEGEIKQSIAGTINPKIKWLKYDTVTDKSDVLYTSELNFKQKK